MADDKKTIKSDLRKGLKNALGLNKHKKPIRKPLTPNKGSKPNNKTPVSQVQKQDAKTLNQMKKDRDVKNATTSNPTPQNKMGASPAEIKRISNANKSAGLKGSTRSETIASGKIKGEADRDLARLEKQKKDSKSFEKSLKGKRDLQLKNTRDPLFDTMSKYMSGGGTVYKGR